MTPSGGLGHGVVTPGEDASIEKLPRFHLPESFSGKTVLDVGAWDGSSSFEAERRGAARVVAVDPACWREPGGGPVGWGSRDGFDLAHEVLGWKVEPRAVGNLAALSPRARRALRRRAVLRRAPPPAEPSW